MPDVTLAQVRPEIENTLYRYAWTFDFDEARGIGDCFTHDIEAQFGDGPTQQGHADVVAELERRRRDNYAPDDVPMHVIANIFIKELTGDRAEVKTYCTFFVKKVGAPVGEPRSQGYYDDILVPDDGTWRIQWRRWMLGTRI